MCLCVGVCVCLEVSLSLWGSVYRYSTNFKVLVYQVLDLCVSFRTIFTSQSSYSLSHTRFCFVCLCVSICVSLILQSVAHSFLFCFHLFFCFVFILFVYFHTDLHYRLLRSLLRSWDFSFFSRFSLKNWGPSSLRVLSPEFCFSPLISSFSLKKWWSSISPSLCMPI